MTNVAVAAAAPDVRVANHGSIFIFHLFTPEARGWVTDHVEGQGEAAPMLTVEHRYAWDIAEGMQGDGLLVV